MNDRIKTLPRWARELIENQREEIEHLRERLHLYEVDEVLTDPRNTAGTIGISLGVKRTKAVFVTPKNGELEVTGYGMIYVQPIAANKVSIRPM